MLPFAEALAKLAPWQNGLALAGTAAPQAKEALARAMLSSIRQPDALWVARLAQPLPATDAPPQPLYLRAPDCETPGAETMTLRRLSPRDFLAPIAALHAACFDDAWSVQSIAGLLETPGTIGLAADDGFILIRGAGGEAEILTLAVRPLARRMGLGRLLVTEGAKGGGPCEWLADPVSGGHGR